MVVWVHITSVLAAFILSSLLLKSLPAFTYIYIYLRSDLRHARHCRMIFSRLQMFLIKQVDCRDFKPEAPEVLSQCITVVFATLSLEGTMDINDHFENRK